MTPQDCSSFSTGKSSHSSPRSRRTDNHKLRLSSRAREVAVSSKLPTPKRRTIWYICDAEDLIVYNRPDARRLRSIASNSRVAFNLRADELGTAGVTLEGEAVVDGELPPAQEFPGFLDKYDEEIESIGMTPASFSAAYSVGIRIAVTRVRAWNVDRLL